LTTYCLCVHRGREIELHFLHGAVPDAPCEALSPHAPRMPQTVSVFALRSRRALGYNPVTPAAVRIVEAHQNSTAVARSRPDSRALPCATSVSESLNAEADALTRGHLPMLSAIPAFEAQAVGSMICMSSLRPTPCHGEPSLADNSVKRCTHFGTLQLLGAVTSRVRAPLARFARCCAESSLELLHRDMLSRATYHALVLTLRLFEGLRGSAR